MMGIHLLVFEYQEYIANAARTFDNATPFLQHNVEFVMLIKRSENTTG